MLQYKLLAPASYSILTQISNKCLELQMFSNSTMGFLAWASSFHDPVCAWQAEKKKRVSDEESLFFRIFRVCDTFRHLKIPGITVIKCDERAVSFPQRS